MSNQVRVAIVGVGNCASSLVQGVEYYRDMPPTPDGQVTPNAGLMMETIGPYRVGDIAFACAFDVAEGKVGHVLSDAIYAEPNNTLEFTAEEPIAGADTPVYRGMTHDGIGKYSQIRKSSAPTVDVAAKLREHEVDVMVIYLPVGSEEATKWYAEQALHAGVAVVNCIPVFLASSEYWSRRFETAGLPIIGDDIKSQVGATILHRALVDLWKERGFRLQRTYQLNVGGNADFRNMLERDRLESKKISKTQSVTSQVGFELPEGDVHVGPSDFVPWLTDRKVAFIRLEGTGFGGAPMSAEVRLEVWDSPNSAGIVIDAVRVAKLGLDRGHAGPMEAASAWYMKSPPLQLRDEQAHDHLLRFINGDQA